ncbi:MAG: hypothetical protein KatS3mg010_0976 [Acidimicrobiia bacterium]|nr:MAG: hypothetical protein KatS3mg010_0976 [Acidimicrobiia bacterium]
MNTIAGKVVNDDGGLAVGLPGARAPLPEALAAAVGRQGVEEVVVGVRPEHLRLDAGGFVPATVTVVESLGHERHVACRLDDGTLVIVRQPSDQHAPAVASTVHLATDAQHLHVFDAATGDRVEAA